MRGELNRFILILAAIMLCTSCGKDKENFIGIEDISFENYPKLDGSTSARALNQMIACKLLGIRYEYPVPYMGSEYVLGINEEDIPEKYMDFFYNRVKTSQTHGAFMNLINGEVDIILTHRTISPDEKAHANDVGVTLIETPIASDAFVFVVNKNNPVKSLSVTQIQKIYTREITNWSQVGVNIEQDVIMPFTRPSNSGSEEVFKTLVMSGLELAGDIPETSFEIVGMYDVFQYVSGYEAAICYTFNNYKDMQARMPDSEVPKIAINGIFPDKNTVKNRTYPFIAEVHVAIRSDLDHHSMAYKLYEWLQSENAKSTIVECGFIPK